MAKWCCDSPVDYQLNSKIQKWECSECKSGFMFTSPPLEQKYHFCPACGSRMDGYERTDKN